MRQPQQSRPPALLSSRPTRQFVTRRPTKPATTLSLSQVSEPPKEWTTLTSKGDICDAHARRLGAEPKAERARWFTSELNEPREQIVSIVFLNGDPNFVWSVMACGMCGSVCLPSAAPLGGGILQARSVLGDDCSRVDFCVQLSSAKRKIFKSCCTASWSQIPWGKMIIVKLYYEIFGLVTSSLKHQSAHRLIGMWDRSQTATGTTSSQN